MYTDRSQLAESDLTEQVIGAFYSVYNELGNGFLESVYAYALALALREGGTSVLQEAPLRVAFRGQTVGEFRADLLVEERLIVEIKAVSHLVEAHEIQLVNYLKACGVHVGLLVNFGPHPEFKRRVFGSASINPPLSALIRVRKENV